MDGGGSGYNNLVKALAGLLLGTLVLAQAPVRVEYACPPEDIDSFGLACSEDDPCAVFLELSAVEALGARLFLSGNLHTASTTLYSVVVMSEDGGKTWTEPHRRLRASALEQIQFFDTAYGWISGQLLDPLPRDPFLLLTNDGGKTWRQRPLSEESGYGSIAEFWFDSRSRGELVLDRSQGNTKRYELFESMTGGEDWAPKQVSASAIHLKKAPSKETAAWRVRADAASKTYRVERGSGASWQAVASFAIESGTCK